MKRKTVATYKGRPCALGHVRRYKSTRHCVECQRTLQREIWRYYNHREVDMLA